MKVIRVAFKKPPTNRSAKYKSKTSIGFSPCYFDKHIKIQIVCKPQQQQGAARRLSTTTKWIQQEETTASRNGTTKTNGIQWDKLHPTKITKFMFGDKNNINKLRRTNSDSVVGRFKFVGKTEQSGKTVEQLLDDDDDERSSSSSSCAGGKNYWECV